MKKIKKIDIHAHSTLYADIIPVHPVGWRTCSPEELIELYDSLNIEKGFLERHFGLRDFIEYIKLILGASF